MHTRGSQRSLLLVFLVIPVIACSGDPDSAPGAPQEGQDPTAAAADSVEVARAVEAMLAASAGSWNAGDLEGFLDDYTDASDLTFTGTSGVQRGKEEVRQRYLAAYWAPGAERDSLRFDSLEVRVLGSDHALVLGRYVLYRPGSEDSGAAETITATGPFTLVLRREGGDWRIIHDHSS